MQNCWKVDQVIHIISWATLQCAAGASRIRQQVDWGLTSETIWSIICVLDNVVLQGGHDGFVHGISAVSYT